MISYKAYVAKLRVPTEYENLWYSVGEKSNHGSEAWKIIKY